MTTDTTDKTDDDNEEVRVALGSLTIASSAAAVLNTPCLFRNGAASAFLYFLAASATYIRDS
jgi:hypothetical protein